MTTAADKRSPDTDALAVLGTIIDDTIGRDAIHLAVEPVVAAMAMCRGQEIGLTADGKAIRAAANSCVSGALGIVDPFLKGGVKTGQRFLMVLKPGQIATLRHVWDHPAFPPPITAAAGVDLGVPPSVDPRAIHQTTNPQTDAKVWLERFAAENSVPYEEMIRGALAWSQHDDAPWWVDADESYDQFWDNLAVLIGATLNRGITDLSCRGC